MSRCNYHNLAGENAPPMHPNCRCSTAAYVDIEDYEKWLSTYKDHELSFREWNNAKKLTDVTQEYLKNAKPNTGKVSIDDGINRKRKETKHDIEVAEWLKNTFGGDINITKPSAKFKQGTPDYDWRGSKWELKTPTSQNAIDKRLQTAGHQLGERGGGIVLDISNVKKMSAGEAVEWIERKLPKRAKGDVDLIVKKDNSFIKAIRYKKK